MKKIGQAGLELIKSFEGCRLTAYQDSVGVWTIGYGHTGSVDGIKIYKGMNISLKKAEQLLIEDCQRFANFVDNKYYCPFDLNKNERDALISFAYNCGQGNLKELCSVASKEKIANYILLYNKAGGYVLKGLVRRRKAERDLFLKEVEDLTADEVRTIVKEVIKEELGKKYTYTEECPEWAKETVQKLLDKKALAVDKGEFKGLSEEQLRLLVIMDRMDKV